MKRTTNLEKKATAKTSSGCRFLASGVDLCFESKPVWALRWALAQNQDPESPRPKQKDKAQNISSSPMSRIHI